MSKRKSFVVILLCLVFAAMMITALTACQIGGVEDVSVTFMNGDEVVKNVYVKKDNTLSKNVIPTVTPDSGYIFVGWFDEYDNKLTTKTVINKPMTFNAKFEKDEEYQPDKNFSVSVANDSSAHAKVTLSVTEGKDGDTFTFTVSVDKGYELVAVTVNGDKVIGKNGTYSGTIDGNTTVKVTTKEEDQPQPEEYDIKVADDSSEYATVNLDKTKGVNGATFTFTVSVEDGYEIVKVTVNGTEVTAEEGTYTGTVDGETTVKVETQEKVPETEYDIKVAEDSSEYATVNLDKTKGVNGATFTFTVSVEDGYEIVKVTVNGTEVTAEEGTYTGTVEGETLVKVETQEEEVPQPEEYEIKVAEDSSENATVTLNKEKGENGETFTFTVSVKPHYEIVSVLVNGKVVTAEEDAYEGIIDGETTVKVVTQDVVYHITVAEKPNADVELSEESGVFGAEYMFTVEANKGFELVSVKINDVEVELDGDSYIGTIEGDVVIKVATAKKQYTVKTECDEHARVIELTPAKGVTNTKFTFKVEVDEHYVASVKVNNTVVNAQNGVYEGFINGETTVKVTTKAKVYNITVEEVENVHVTVEYDESVYDADYILTVEVEQEYRLVALLVNGVDVKDELDEDVYMGKITGNTEIKAVVEEIGYSVTVDCDEHSHVTNLSAEYGALGTRFTFKAEADEHFEITSVKINGTEVEPAGGIYRGTITEDMVISVTSQDIVYKVTVAKGITNATVSLTKTEGTYGTEFTFTVTPNQYYRITSVKLGGEPVTAENGQYKGTITGDLEITVTVVAIAKLATPELTLDEETGLASWTAVTGATKYAYIKNEEDEVQTTELSLQLEDGDTLIVKAVGDGITYRDGNYSEEVHYSVLAQDEFKIKATVKNASVKFSDTTVPAGTEVTFEVKVNAGYSLVSVKVGDETLTPGEDGKYSYTVNDHTTVVVTTAPNNYEITLGDHDHATVTVDETATFGTTVEFTVVADTGYLIASVSVNDEHIEKNDNGKYEFEVGLANVITVTTAPNEYAITVGAHDHATVSITGKITKAEYGTEFTFKVTPAEEGYKIVTVKHNEIELTADENGLYTATVSTTNEITVVAEPKTVNIVVVNADNDHATVNVAETATFGEQFTFTVTPDQGYRVKTVYFNDRNPLTASNGVYTCTAVLENKITVTTEQRTYTITVSGENAEWELDVKSGVYDTDYELTVVPHDGYEIVSVTANGTLVLVDECSYIGTIDVYENITIVIETKGIEYTVTAETDGHAEVELSLENGKGDYGDEFTFTVTVDSHYAVDVVSVNNDEVVADENGVYSAVIHGKIEILVLTKWLPHSFGELVECTATCTVAGQKAHYHCDLCDKDYDVDGETVLEDLTQEALGHNWGVVTVTTPATCTDDGEGTQTCTRCPETQTVTVEALGHDWGEWEITEATCTDDGKKTRGCSRCDATETQTISATGSHSYVHHEAKDATCTEDGVAEYWTCENCGGVFSDENGTAFEGDVEVPALGHSWGEEELTPDYPCLDRFAIKTCSVCGEKEERLEREAKGNHDFEAHNVTCAVCGTIDSEYLSCEVSGTVALTFPDDNNKNNQKGSYTNEWVAKIGSYEWNIVNFNNNNWNNWNYIKAGTNSTITTKALGAISKVVMTIDAITTNSVTSITLLVSENADMSDPIETIDGTKAKGDCEFIIVNPAPNMYYQIKIIATATKAVTISKVEYIGEDSEHFAKADTAEVSEATCTEDGKVSFKCTTEGCDITHEVAIEALGHNYELVEEVPAKCEVNGTKAHYECTHCHEWFLENADGEYELVEKDDQRVIIGAIGHNPSEVWSYDETGHWHACANDGSEKLDLEAHADDLLYCEVCEYQSENAHVTLTDMDNNVTYYANIASAVENLSENGTITLLGDWSEDLSEIDWNGKYVTFELATYTLTLSKELTVDSFMKINGGTVTLASGAYIEVNAELTLSDVTVSGVEKALVAKKGTTTFAGTISISAEIALEMLYNGEKTSVVENSGVELTVNGKVVYGYETVADDWKSDLVYIISGSEYAVEENFAENETKKEYSTLSVFKDALAPIGEEHVHEYNNEWTTDEYTHWHQCIGDNCVEKQEEGDHEWVTIEGEGKRVEATCDNDGFYTQICTVCDREQQVTIDKHHTLEGVDPTPATCTEKAKIAHIHCTECGMNFDGEGNPLQSIYDENSELAEHDFANGLTCEECKTLQEKYLSAPAGEGSVVATALFGADYNSQKTSSYSNNSWTSTNDGFTVQLVNFNNNNNGWAYIKAGTDSTITANASVAISKVVMTIDAITVNSVTSITLRVSENADMSNSVETIVGTKATGRCEFAIQNPAPNMYYRIEISCTTTKVIQISKVEYYGTSVHTAAGTKLTDKTDDGEDVFTVNKPTCDKPGSVEFICGKEGCTEKHTVVIPATGHSYGEVVVTPATCTEDGSKKQTCSVCGHVHTEVTEEATGHTYGEWVIDKEATCIENGSKHRDCACGDKQTEVIPATGEHNWSEDYDAEESIEPDCTEGGILTYHCTTEGCTEKNEVIVEALGHIDEDKNEICDRCSENIGTLWTITINYAFSNNTEEKVDKDLVTLTWDPADIVLTSVADGQEVELTVTTDAYDFVSIMSDNDIMIEDNYTIFEVTENITLTITVAKKAPKEVVNLDAPVVAVDSNGLASWVAVENGNEYSVYVNGELVKTQSETTYQLTNGETIKVVANGYETDTTVYVASSESNEVTYTQSNEKSTTYTFGSNDSTATSAISNANLLTIFTGAVSEEDTDIVESLSATLVYTANSNNDSLKFGSGSGGGQLQITLKDGLKATKIVINCKIYGSDVSTVIVTADGNDKNEQNAPNTADNLTFELTTPVNVFTISTGGSSAKKQRGNIYSITIYYE